MEASYHLFIVWNKALDRSDEVVRALSERYAVLRQWEVSWPRRSFSANLSALYGLRERFRWFMKSLRCGKGPFRVILVRDDAPAWRTAGEELPEENATVVAFKKAWRKRLGRSNVIHASVNASETEHNLKALFGRTVREILSERGEASEVVRVSQTEPIPYVDYPYWDDAARMRWIGGMVRRNRLELELLPNVGLPTIVSFRFRFAGVFAFAFCLGKVKY